MASQNVSRADIYPDGTSVGAYPKSQWTTSQLPPSGAPPGAPTSSATVTGGVAALTGLADATNYYAGGQVGGVWRYVAFRTPNAAAAGSGVPAGGTTGQQLTKISNADGDAGWASGGGFFDATFTGSGTHTSTIGTETIRTANITLTAAHTETVAGLASGKFLFVRAKQNATGGFALSISDGTNPPLTPPINLAPNAPTDLLIYTNGTDLDVTVLGVPGAVASVTKRARISLSADGAATPNSTITDWQQRHLFQFPFGVSRWRLVVRNASAVDSSVNTGAVTLDVFLGAPTYLASGAQWDGTLSAAATRALAQFSTPSDGSEFTTAWVTTVLPAVRQTYALCIGGTCPGGTTLVKGGLGSYLTFGAGAAASAGVASPVGSVALGNAFLDIRMEVEYVTPQVGGMPVGVFLGDSITGGWSSAPLGAFTHQAWPGAGGLRNGYSWINLGVGGARASDWAAATTAWRWARNDWATSVPDFAVVSLGYNDVNQSRTASAIETDIATIIASLRTKGIQQIFLGTIAPGNFAATPEAVRVAVNNWMRTCPNGVAGVLDFDKALYVQAVPATGDADYFASYPHPTLAGYQKMASIVTGAQLA